MYNIAILASGSGTNAENIVRTFNEGTLLRVRLCITDHADAGVVERMRRYGVKTLYVAPKIWRHEPEKVVEMLRADDIDLVVLAGFMRLVSPVIVSAYAGRILNLHPSLLPKYGGKGMWGHHVHEAVIAAGEKESGVTVHYIDEEYDRGEILMQERVEILPDDTAETLEAKIHEAEYRLYPRAISEALRRMTPPTPPPLPPAGGEPVAVPPALPGQEPAAPGECMVEEPDREATEVDTVPLPQGTPVPPPVEEQPRNVDREWADALKIKYDPEKIDAPQAAQPGMQPAMAPGVQCANQAEVAPMPPNYLVLSILATLLCCFIPGVIAIVYSSKVSNAYFSGDLDGARRASRNAEIWIIASFCLGVIWGTLSLPMMIVRSALGL